jgi:hypothetical protein
MDDLHSKLLIFIVGQVIVGDVATAVLLLVVKVAIMQRSC